MTKARLDGLYLVLLGSVAFLLLGVALERSAPAPLADFKALYYPSRCLIQQHDPYMESEVRRIYEAEGETGHWIARRLTRLQHRMCTRPARCSSWLPSRCCRGGLYTYFG